MDAAHPFSLSGDVQLNPGPVECDSSTVEFDCHVQGAEQQ